VPPTPTKATGAEMRDYRFGLNARKMPWIVNIRTAVRKTNVRIG